MSLLKRPKSGGPRDDDPSDPAQTPLGEPERAGLEETQAAPDARAEESAIAGERGASAFSGARSLQSRVTNVLAIGLIGTLAAGLLGWYYVRTAARPAVARHAAQAAAQNKAEGDLRLPPLGRVDPPPAALASMLGPAPAPPPITADSSREFAGTAAAPEPVPAAQPPSKAPWQLALERRLGGPVSVTGSGNGEPAAAGGQAGSAESASGESPGIASDPGESGLASSRGRTGAAVGEGALVSRLRPSVTPAVAARVLPTQRLLLPKGAFIDCTLETAINSSLPGLTTCVTATDTFGADGEVVLMERGTKLTGETVGTVQRGAARVFVLWTEARTPTGVVIPLASPGTDALGRSGLAGQVNRHFFERFGAAILISMIDGGVQGAVGSQHATGTVVYNPSASQDVMTEVLKGTIDVPPTVEVSNGDRIQVLVARDLDFRSVYELRSAAVSR